MSQDFTLSIDQRLSGKSNYPSWNVLIKTAAMRCGLQDYLTNDIHGTLANYDFVINLGANDIFNQAALRIIIETASSYPNSSLRRIYNVLQGERPDSQEEDKIIDDISYANVLVNKAINRREIIESAKRENAQVLLMLIRNVKENILKEVSRLTQSCQVYSKLASKYGSGNADTEYWLKEIQKLKAKNLSQISKTIESMLETFTEMDGSNVVLSDREKIKFMFNALPESFRENLDVNLKGKVSEFYDMVKRKVSTKSYLENWETEKEDSNDPMEIDLVSRNGCQVKEQVKGETTGQCYTKREKEI